MNLYNFESQVIYNQDNIERGYQYFVSNPDYKVYITLDVGQKYFNKIGVCLKYINHESLEIQEDAIRLMDKAISKLLSFKWIGYIPTIRTTSTELASSSTTKYYAVKVGRRPGIYTNWKETCEQVLGFPANQHKSFNTLLEAQSYLEE
jgi:hypothetical protein